MATYIKTLKEDNGDITYPQTKAEAVLLNNGSDLEAELSQYVTAEEIGSTSVVDYSEILSKIYPVGSIYMSATLSTAAQVNTALGGTWIAWGAGRVPVGIDTTQTEFNTIEKTGGEKTHTLTIDEMPRHQHQAGYTGSGTAQKIYGWYGTSGSAMAYDNLATGGSQAHNNLQPYITCYMYKRIS